MAKARKAPPTTYRLRDGRQLQAISEDVGWTPNGIPRDMVFIKEGERYVPLEEQAALEFYDDKLRAWLRLWN